jgi:hypothetical protein
MFPKRPIVLLLIIALAAPVVRADDIATARALARIIHDVEERKIGETRKCLVA